MARLRASTLILLLLACTLLAPPALAEGAPIAKPEVTVSELPPSAAKRLIVELQKNLRKEKLSEELIERPVGEAIRAADRARGANDAGDSRNSTLLMKLAEQWASAGKAVLRAVLAEREAKKQASALAELTTKVKRAEALLHEQQSRLGRLRTELQQLEAAVAAKKSATAETEKKRVEKTGTKKPAKPTKKGKP
jgi:hypothetical protein